MLSVYGNCETCLALATSKLMLDRVVRGSLTVLKVMSRLYWSIRRLVTLARVYEY